jgi:hypothetical protein
MRAVSTVLDVSLCLLFVAASALTLVGTPVADQSSPEAGPDSADESVEVLTTTTASVSYGVGDRNRTAHDTLAGLLATAALADARRASVVEFRDAVADRVTHALGHLDANSLVVADPSPESDSIPSADSSWTDSADGDATLADPVAVGTPPPPDADVHAATVRVRAVRLTVRTWFR